MRHSVPGVIFHACLTWFFTASNCRAAALLPPVEKTSCVHNKCFAAILFSLAIRLIPGLCGPTAEDRA
jgi:hypothetical protein